MLVEAVAEVVDVMATRVVDVGLTTAEVTEVATLVAGVLVLIGETLLAEEVATTFAALVVDVETTAAELLPVSIETLYPETEKTASVPGRIC